MIILNRRKPVAEFPKKDIRGMMTLEITNWGWKKE